MYRPNLQFKSFQKKKTLLITKLPPSSTPKYKDALSSLFDNPSTYLNLPSESTTPYVVGKKLTGPRFNSDDQVIPYSIVGTQRLFKRKGQLVNANNISRTTTGNRRMTSRNTIIHSDFITDKQIESIFSKHRDSLSLTTTNTNNSIYRTIPHNMEDKVIKPLKSQEVCLSKHVLNDQYRKSLSNKIKYKLYNTTHYHTKSNPLSLSNNKNKVLFLKRNLLLDKVDMFRMKKETKDYAHTIVNDIDLDRKYGKYSWVVGLRRKNNTCGIRKNYINIGNQERPVWCTIREKFPVVNETVVAPGECSGDKMFMQSTSVDTFVKAAPVLNGYVKRTLDLVELEVNGKGLLEFEEENCKQLKGRKKLVDMKHGNDSVKNLDIAEDWK